MSPVPPILSKLVRAGRPLVLARVGHWNPTDAEELTLRAQLRGLGARLAVHACDCAVLLDPDDPPLRLEVQPALAPLDGIEVRIVDAELHTEWQSNEPTCTCSPAALLIAALREAVARKAHASLLSRLTYWPRA